jgi:hypothetical protein
MGWRIGRRSRCKGRRFLFGRGSGTPPPSSEVTASSRLITITILVVVGSTVLFMFLWLLDPSILTVVSVFGLCVTVSDYVIPSVASSFFKPEKWTARREKEFEELCTNIVLYKARLELTWSRYYKLKTTNRKLYFILTICGLSVLAWIGCTFNNLFLAYVLVTFLVLLPGMEHNGIISKCSEYVHNFLAEFLRQAKSKVDQEKKED